MGVLRKPFPNFRKIVEFSTFWRHWLGQYSKNNLFDHSIELCFCCPKKVEMSLVGRLIPRNKVLVELPTNTTTTTKTSVPSILLCSSSCCCFFCSTHNTHFRFCSTHNTHFRFCSTHNTQFPFWNKNERFTHKMKDLGTKSWTMVTKYITDILVRIGRFVFTPTTLRRRYHQPTVPIH